MMLSVSGVVAVVSQESEIESKDSDHGTTFFLDTVARVKKNKKDWNIRRLALFVPKNKISLARKHLKRKQLLHLLHATWSVKKEMDGKEKHWISTTWNNVALIPYALNNE